MRFSAKVDGAEHAVIASPDGTVAVDGQVHSAKVTKPAPERRAVTVAEKSYEVRVIEGSAEKGEFLIELGGERILVGVSSVQRGATFRATGTASAAAGAAAAAAKGAAKAAADASAEGVRAPMPGKVLEVFVEPGDKVDAGDVVLILEAMKMENELKSPRKGTIKSVNVKKGDPVAGQQLLVVLD
jgi:biotin carboxyl carrier protein